MDVNITMNNLGDDKLTNGRYDLINKMICIEQQQDLQVPIDIPKPNDDDDNDTDDDQIKQPDFVLVYLDNGNVHNVEKRVQFEAELRDQGLELEYENNRQLCFVKINAPQEVLCRYCEIMKLKMPIKPLSNQELNDTASDIFNEAKSWFINLFNFVQLDKNKFPILETKLSSEFSRDKNYLFDVQNENFFPTNIRVMIIDFILERQCAGIQRLIANGVYIAAYPLHDGSFQESGSTRCLLYEEWGSTSKWLKLQPLDTIQEYFGVNFAIYFAWLGFYTYMLIPASIAGLFCFFYGWLTLSSNQLAIDACSDEFAGQITMCPPCDKSCNYWKLIDTCLLTKVTLLFDHPATTLFAIFMSFWSILYLELWRRKSEELSHRWGLVGWDQAAEHPRPQYIKMLNKINIFKIKEKLNPVTREKEPHVSFWKVRVPATMISFSVVFLLIIVAIAAVFAVILYRMSMITSNTLFGTKIDDVIYKTFVLPIVAAGINLVCILLLNYFYDWLAIHLTEMEMLRTQTEYDDSLTLKIYIFQFVNYYASIFYVAFIKGKFVGYPKKYNRIFGFRQEECAPGGCLMELGIQLAIIMIGKQALYTAMEMIWPLIFRWWAFFRAQTGDLIQKDSIVSRKQWIRDFKLLDWSPRGLYDEYLEAVIQFGFITLFVVAFPLAPLFALANNVLEMRLDAKKFLRHYRRPVPRRARDIGIWKQILDTLARISITTNAFIIAFSSNLVPRFIYMTYVSENNSDYNYLNYSLAYFDTKDFQVQPTTLFDSTNITICRYSEYRNPPNHELPYKRPTIYWRILAARFIFVVVFQSIVGLFSMIVQWCLSGIPRKLRDRIKREAYLTEEIIIKREAERAREKARYLGRFSSSVSNQIRKRSPVITETNTT